MIKKVFGKKLSRSRTARDAMVRSLIRGIVDYGKIITTYAKAKVVRIYLEKIMTAAIKADIASRRRVYASLANDRDTTDRLFEIAKHSNRKSGFVRILQLPPRRGDAAAMARIELIDWVAEEKSIPKKVHSSQVANSKRDDKTGMKSLPVLSKDHKKVKKPIRK